MKSIDFSKVRLNGGLLGEKYVLNQKITVHCVWERFAETGRTAAFQCVWRPEDGGEKKPHIFWDSDVAKWMEAAAYLLRLAPDPELEARIELIIDAIEANQWEDGYINSYYTAVEPENRFTDRSAHELYCAGHLLEAALAYQQATGRERFLRLVLRYVALIDRCFRLEKTAAFDTPGHEELELALLKLYEWSGEPAHLALAEYFLETRGNSQRDMAFFEYGDNYTQSHLPIRRQTSAVGHSVRAVYLYAAMAELARVKGDAALRHACEALFADMTAHKMYITGGLGNSFAGEGFTVPYDLTNEHAYAETCASIGMIYFCDRMWQMTGEAKYADVIETELYNGMLSGLSLDGTSFFYENPLEINLANRKRKEALPFFCEHERFPITQRVRVFECSCCPPNLNRILASLGGYLYGTDGGTLYVNQFADSQARCGDMEVIQRTDYPRGGAVSLRCRGVRELRIRKPGWCDRCTVSMDYTLEAGYLVIKEPEDEVRVDFGMEPFLVSANPRVWENNGKAALQRGPVVYCAEGIDNPVPNLNALYIDRHLQAEEHGHPSFALPMLSVKGFAEEPSDVLYRKFADTLVPVTLEFIPYHAFANRGETDMRVWFNCR